MSALKKKKKYAGGRAGRRPPAKRARGEEVRPSDAGEIRRRASASYRKARARQDAEEKKHRRDRRRRQREVEPFRFRDVKQKKVVSDESTGRKADVLYSLALCIAVVGIAIFVMCAFFKVRSVSCVGAEHYSASLVVGSSGIEQGDRMLLISRRSAAGKIMDRLPYIKSVAIRQRFPSDVVISVQERVPAAKIIDGIFSYIFDSDGYLLEYTVSGANFDLPEIKCAPPRETACGKQMVFDDPLMLETLQNVLKYIVNSEWMKYIDYIDVAKIYSVSFMYQGRLQVRLGDTSDLEMKLALLAEVIKRNGEDAAGVIDVSSTQRVSYQPGL